MLSAPAVNAQLARVIIHIDLDCFYAQVEQKRLGIPRDVPCAVQQWEGLIAVNYAARSAGVTRHMRVHQAKKHCPELRLVHVQTIGHVQMGGSTNAAAALAAAEAAGSDAATGPAPAADHDAAAIAPSSSSGTAASEVEGSALDRGSSKACLQRYRRASAEIMRLLSQMCPGCLLEKASIDEAYLDITQMAARQLNAAEKAAIDGTADGVDSLLARAAEGSVVLGQGGLSIQLDYDRLAAAGAVIALRLREEVLSQLGYTASAGIGPNKLLAKIGSAKNKPNKQTIVLPRAVEELMQDLSFGKVKGLGGKLGQQLEQLGVTTAGQAAGLPWETLVKNFGSKSRWVFNTVRGKDDEPVTPKDKVKSINSCKSFTPINEVGPLAQWLEVLAAELAERMQEDEAEHGRRPRSLVLQYRGGAAPANSRGVIPDRSIRGPMPVFNPRDTADPESIAAAALGLFKRIKPPPWPLVRLALVATEFVDMAGAGAGSGAAMARFLAAGAEQQHVQQQQLEAGRVEQRHSVSSRASVPSQQGKNGNQQRRLEQYLAQPKQQPVLHPEPAPQQQHEQQQLDQQQVPVAQLERQLQQQCAAGQQQHSQVVGESQPKQCQWHGRPAEPAETYALRAAGDQLEPQQEMPQEQLRPADSSTVVHASGLASKSLSTVPEGLSLLPAATSVAGHSVSTDGMQKQATIAFVGATKPAQQQEHALLQQVDVAEQARILRDIEIRGMLSRQPQHGKTGQTPSTGSKKRASDGQQQHAGSRLASKKQDTKKGGKQMSISDLFTGRGGAS